MSRYLYLYKGPATPMEQFTPEQTAEQTKAWGDWMNGVGAALVDPGAPFATRDAVGDDGTSRTPSDLNGGGIAVTQRAAVEHAQLHALVAA